MQRKGSPLAWDREPAPNTRQRIVDLLDRMSALLDDVERDLDDATRRARAWARVRAVHDTLDELLRDEGLIDLTDAPAEREATARVPGAGYGPGRAQVPDPGGDRPG